MFSRFALAVASLCLLPAGAQAQTYWGNPNWGPGYSEGNCQMACPQDYSPCDPLYFKQADRRCRVDIHNGGHHHH